MRKLQQWRRQMKQAGHFLRTDDRWLWWINALLALSLLPTTNVWGFYG